LPYALLIKKERKREKLRSDVSVATLARSQQGPLSSRIKKEGEESSWTGSTHNGRPRGKSLLARGGGKLRLCNSALPGKERNLGVLTNLEKKRRWTLLSNGRKAWDP